MKIWENQVNCFDFLHIEFILLAEIFGFKLIWEALNKYFHAFNSSFQSVDHNFCACTSWKAGKNVFHSLRFGKTKSIALIFFTLHSIFAEIFGFKLIWEALNKYFHAFYSSFQSVDHNFCACTSWKAAKTILYLKGCSYGRSILRISWKLRYNIRSKSCWRLFSIIWTLLTMPLCFWFIVCL